jgi:hypothetical protein
MSFNLLKLLKFKSFCNVNQHYLITPPPSSPSSPLLPLLPPFFPPNFPIFFFWGGGKGTGGQGTGGQGTGGQGRGRAGTHCTAPPWTKGGGRRPPPFSLRILQKKLFYAGSFKNILLFSLTLYSPCVIYPRGFSQSTAQNYKNLCYPLNKIHCGILQWNFKNLIFLSLNISSLCAIIHHWRIIYFE